MRFFTLLALLPLAFSLAPLISRTAATNDIAKAIADAQVETFVDKQGRAYTCDGFSTRRPNCKCRDGLIKPEGYKPYGQQPRDNCQCADEKNSQEYKDKKGITRCTCPGGLSDTVDKNEQYYDYDNNKCACESNDAKEKYNNKGKLTCKVKTPPPQPSPKTGGKKTRSLNDALAERRAEMDSRAVETVLRCEASEKACQVGSEWSCIEVMNSLATCGGCAGESIDCGSLPNVNEVHCSAGHCVIDSCARGSKLSLSTSANGTTTTCEPIRRTSSSWFSVQGSDGL